MKKVFYTLAVILLFLSSCGTYKSAQITDISTREKEVTDAVEQFRKAIIDADRTVLENIFADKLVYGHSNGKVQNKAECIDEIVSLQPNDYQTITLTDQTITISGETAVVRHIYSADFISKGVKGSLRIGNVLIWQKQEGKWKLLARQAYKL